MQPKNRKGFQSRQKSKAYQATTNHILFYYDWLQRKLTDNEQEDAELITLIRALFSKSRATYGTRRLKKVLLKQGKTITRRRIGRLMQEAERPQSQSMTCRLPKTALSTKNRINWNIKLSIAL